MWRRYGSFGACAALVGCCLFVLTLVLAGCSSPAAPPEPGPPDAGPPDAGPAGCAAGELTRDDGTCQPAGLPPDMPCPPGEMPRDDGACQPAGVPPEACAAGLFEPDGDGGCEPILPAEPCPEGQMAVPGETVCHEVAPCGGDTWGDIPVEPNTQFVDQAYAGGNNDGTQDFPWTSIQQGIDAAEPDAIVAVAAGSYAEDVNISNKPVRLWGRCPGMVEISGVGVQLATLEVLEAAAGGTEVRGVAVTGVDVGIGVVGASDVVIEQVWVHDTGYVGITIEDAFGPTSAELKASLIERSHGPGVNIVGSQVAIETTMVRGAQPFAQEEGGYGIFIQVHADVTVHACLVEESYQVGVLVEGSNATIEATVVRGTHPDAPNGAGIAIEYDPIDKMRANLTVRACMIEQSHGTGVLVAGSDAMIEATVVRATQPDAEQERGYGIYVRDASDAMERADVTVRACLVDQNHNIGVHVDGSDALIEATVVRATKLDAPGERGFGIGAHDYADIEEHASLTVRACLVDQNHTVGVHVDGPNATIEATVVRATQPNAQGLAGHGIHVRTGPDMTKRASLTARACLVEESHEVGVLVIRADAMIEATVVRATQPNAQQGIGVGIAIQDDPAATERADVTLRACLVEESQGAGVDVSYAGVTIESTTVRKTAATSDTMYGDGIVVVSSDVTIHNTEVTDNDRAGVSNFGGQVTITGSVFTCNGFDLDYEASDGKSGSFDGSTGWQCTDPYAPDCTALGECKAVTSGIGPPPRLPTTDPFDMDR